MKNSVIRRVQELCKERNMSLYKLAKLSNIPNTTLTNMVAQNKMPTIPTIERICHGFDITLAQFFIKRTVSGCHRRGASSFRIMGFSDRSGKGVSKGLYEGAIRCSQQIRQIGLKRQREYS